MRRPKLKPHNKVASKPASFLRNEKSLQSTMSAEKITLTNIVINKKVQKGVAKMKHGPDLRSKATSFRSVGHFGESLFGIILYYTNQSHFFWYQFTLQNFEESYLPTQKFAKIFPKISSGVVSPVISARKDKASSKSWTTASIVKSAQETSKA